jgi:uncharacterized protein (TIRG00374 family)
MSTDPRDLGSGTPAAGASWKARAGVWLRWLGTLSLGAFLVARSDLGPAAAIIARIEPHWLALAVCLYCGDRCAASAKWMLLLSARGHSIPFWTALSIYLQSSFLGAVLPATVGSDLVRARMAQPHAGSFASSLSAVIVERLAGVVALVLAAAIGLALFAPISTRSAVGTPVLWVTALTLLLIGAALDLARPRRGRTEVGAPRNSWTGRVGRFARELAGRLGEYRGRGKFVAAAFAISIGQLYLFTLINWLLAMALGLEVRLFTMLWVWPIVLMAVRIPISVLGFGVREVLLVELIAGAGVSEAGAVALGLASGLLDIFFILLGGVLLLFLPATQLSQNAAKSRPTGSTR